MLKKPKNEERMTNNNSDDDCTADELPDIDAGNCFKKLKRTELACEAPMIENLEELPDVYCMQSPSQYDQKESQTSKASDDQVNNTSPVLKPEKVSKTDPHAFPLRKKRLCKPWDEYSVTLPSKSDGKTLIFTRKPTFSLAGSSRDTAEETSARCYQNYLWCKKRIADYDRKLREQFTDIDSDDSIEHYKREADRRRWMDKKAILSERIKNLVALNGGPFDVDLALKNTDDSCDDLPSLYPPSSCAAVDTMNDLMDEALNSSKTGSDDDIIVEDKSSFRRRVKHTLGFKRRPKMWQKKRKCDDTADVVDLTNEIDSNDDGDVEVLQHDKPVVYLKTESRRKKRRSSLRLTENNSTTAAAAAQTIDLVAPEAAIQPQPIDFNDPNLLFGTLLEQPERFVVPKLDEKQDSPDSTNIKATSGPDLLAASGPLNKLSGNSDEGHLCSGSGSSNAPNKVDPLIPSHLYAGPSASSFSSNSTRDPHRLDDKSPVAIEKIWEMLNIPDEDMQTVRLHHQASSSGSLPVPDSVCLPNYGRSASPPSPYRTAPPPGCCPDNDSLHDSVTRPLNLKSGPGALVSGAAIDNSDMHISNNTTTSSSQGPHGDISQGAVQTRSLINHAAQPNKVDMGHRPFLQPNRFGPSQSSSNPFGIGPSTFLPINRPTCSGREPLTGASTSGSQDDFLSRFSSSASRSCNGLQRAPSGPIFPSTSASFIGPLVNPFLSKRPIMNGSQPELPSGRIEPSLTGRNQTFPSMPPSQACTRVMRSASIPSNPLHPVPWVRMFRENDPVPSSAFSNPMGAAAGASIPLPPSVTTQCASASVFPFSGSTRPYVSSSLMSMNMQGSSSIANPTAAGVAGPSNNNSAQNDLRRDVSGPPTAAGTSTNNSSRTSLASARGANDVMVLGEDDDMNVVNISTPAEEEDDEPESEEASTEPSSPDDTERSSRSDKPTSAAPPAPAKSKASSSSGNDFEISCPICCDTLMDIKERRGHLVSTVCGHLFCEVCLDAAVRRTKQCPTCRRRLTKRQFHKLFI
ncbi:endochitinase A-like [Hyalella azteca]|uniref:Endochitinase A-like n=1 Tax=Hyalella azteca TaxID=294128 RepID=A0A8B7P2T2_HYAAZ|nr:endochitinase A-like [Hyalella azteca]